jgi:DNA-directed RNA polymerase subunit H (RpoH/RPB5)
LADTSDHEFVPIHKLLSEKEANAILDKLMLKRENLPKILVEDPQAKRLNAKAGQIIKINRKDNGHEYEYFRFVVEA